MAYVDTNVLIAAYAPNDPIHRSAKTFLRSNLAPRVISGLTFTELCSVLSRIEGSLEVPVYLRKESAARRIRAVVEYIVRDTGVTLAMQVGSSRIQLGGRSVVIPMEYTKAASLATKLRLRTLDLLHLAYAHLIGRLEFSIPSFVTGDDAIAARAQEIHEFLGVSVKHPEDAV